MITASTAPQQTAAGAAFASGDSVGFAADLAKCFETLWASGRLQNCKIWIDRCLPGNGMLSRLLLLSFIVLGFDSEAYALVSTHKSISTCRPRSDRLMATTTRFCVC
jgi:hypothetical protein